MAVAGFQTELKLSSGSTAFSGASTTVQAGTSVPNSVFRIDDALKRMLDPSSPLTVKVGGVAAAAGSFSVDYLFGEVTFTTDQGASAVTVDGSALSLVSFAETTECDLSLTADMLEDTSFDSGGCKSRRLGPRDAAVTVTQLASLLYDEDPSATERRVFDVLDGGDPILVEVDFGGTQVFRGWMLVSEGDEKLSASSLDEATVKLVPATLPAQANRLFGFGTP